MARPQTHKDFEYAVDDASGKQRIFKSSNEAAGFAVSIAMSRGTPVNLDVLVYSPAGARAGTKGRTVPQSTRGTPTPRCLIASS